MVLEALFQFTLGFPRAKDQDGIGLAQMGNDRVVVACELTGILPLPRVIGRNILGFKSP